MKSIRCWRLGAVGLALCAATARGGDPIPVEPDRRPMAEYYAAHLAFELSSSVEVFKTSVSSDEPSYDDAVVFLEGFAKYRVRTDDCPQLKNLEPAGQELVDAGCDDPMVLFGLGSLINDRNHNSRAQTYLVKAVDLMGRSKYPRHRLAQAASCYGGYLDAWSRRKESHAMHQMAVDSYIGGITLGEYAPEHQRFLVKELDAQIDKTMLPSDLARELTERLAKIPDIEPWTRAMVQGRGEFRVARDARGGGWARDVPEEAWDVFRVRMAETIAYMTRAQELRPDRPEAATLMISVAMHGYGEESERYWFDRAVAAQFDWDNAYRAYLVSLWPRWGGGNEQLYEFGLECMRTERYDTKIPYNFIRALRDMGSGPDAFEFWNRPGVYDNARTVLNNLIKQPAHRRYLHWRRSQLIATAWAVDNWPDCRIALDQLEGDMQKEVLENFDVTEAQIREDCALATSKVGDVIRRGDELAMNGDFDGAIREYERAGADGDTPGVRRIADDRRVTVRQYRDFITDEWVPLTFEEGLPGWTVIHGTWQRSSDNAVKGGPDEDGLHIASQTPFGQQWELEGAIDTEPLGGSKRSNAGVTFLLNDDAKPTYWQSVTFYNRTHEILLRDRFNPTNEIKRKHRAPQRNQYKFHLKVWSRQVVLYVNDKLVHKGAIDTNPRWKDGPWLGLGGRYWFVNGYARFKDLRIRRLTEVPEELTATDQDN